MNNTGIIGGGHHGHGGLSVFGLDLGLITGLLLIVFVAIAVFSMVINIKATHKNNLKKWHRIGAYGAIAILCFHGVYNYIIHFYPK